jgi:DNA-binding SARP family transcriptional activator
VVATESRVEGAPVVVCLFGVFGVMKSGADVPLRPGGKTEALMSELALHDAGASRDELVTAIWPGADPELAAHSLRSLVHSLHQQFGDVLHGAAPVVRSAGRYSLNWGAGVATDVAAFEATADRGERAMRAGDESGVIGAYMEAVRLYRGELCVGSDVRHVLHRERLRLRYLTMRAALSEYAFRDAEYRTALEHASALLKSDPCREDAYRLAMRCHVRLGERAQALRQYQICRSVLKAEFDAEPEAATTNLYHEVRLRPGSV